MFNEHNARQLEEILLLARLIDERTSTMADAIADLQAEIANLTAEVAKDTSVESSALKLIQGFNAQLSAVEAGTQSIAGLRSQLMTSADALANAVAANTAPAPAAPAPDAGTTSVPAGTGDASVSTAAPASSGDQGGSAPVAPAAPTT